jgi:hypothetical protein
MRGLKRFLMPVMVQIKFRGVILHETLAPKHNFGLLKGEGVKKGCVKMCNGQVKF